MKLSVVTPLWQDRPPAENMEVARNADQLGYSELWIGEMATYDAFSFATAAGLNTQQIGLTVGPLAVSVRTPMTMADQDSSSVQAAAADGMIEPEEVAERVIEGLEQESFIILTHPEVQTYIERKAADYDRWIRGMNRLHRSLSGEQ